MDTILGEVLQHNVCLPSKEATTLREKNLLSLGANSCLFCSGRPLFRRDKVKLASYKSALNHRVVYSTDCSMAVVPVLVLLFVVYSTTLCLTLCYFVFVFFSPFSIAITSLGEERAKLSAFCTFVRFALVWSVSSSSWCLDRAAFCDSGTPWTFLLHLFGKRKQTESNIICLACSWEIYPVYHVPLEIKIRIRLSRCNISGISTKSDLAFANS